MIMCLLVAKHAQVPLSVSLALFYSAGTSNVKGLEEHDRDIRQECGLM